MFPGCVPIFSKCSIDSVVIHSHMFVQIKNSYSKADKRNPYHRGSLCTNYCEVVCGPIPPRWAAPLTCNVSITISWMIWVYVSSCHLSLCHLSLCHLSSFTAWHVFLSSVCSLTTFLLYISFTELFFIYLICYLSNYLICYIIIYLIFIYFLFLFLLFNFLFNFDVFFVWFFFFVVSFYIYFLFDFFSIYSIFIFYDI